MSKYRCDSYFEESKPLFRQMEKPVFSPTPVFLSEITEIKMSLPREETFRNRNLENRRSQEMLQLDRYHRDKQDDYNRGGGHLIIVQQQMGW